MHDPPVALRAPRPRVGGFGGGGGGQLYCLDMISFAHVAGCYHRLVTSILCFMSYLWDHDPVTILYENMTLAVTE